MNKIKKGDIVGRISYGNDILFIVKRIIEDTKGKKTAILKGLMVRIEADAPIEDLQLIEKRIISDNINKLEKRILKRIEKCLDSREEEMKQAKKLFNSRSKKIMYTGKILHLDGDKKYSEKSLKYYKSLGLNAIVKNIPENRQASVVKSLLARYEPDILVLTGHGRK